MAGIWERFFSVAFHITASALVGWGLARGKTWQMYLLAAFWHAVLNYNVVLYQTQTIGIFQVEIAIAVEASLLFGLVLWLRWRKQETQIPDIFPDDNDAGGGDHSEFEPD
ncbi:MAG: YhfC family glutamic-type intramembrane protease [Chloroflexota bacterium]